MKKPMMLGMAALALTVTVAPMQAQASQGNCIQVGNTVISGVNCDTENVKDMIQNMRSGNCDISNNLNNIFGNSCGNIGNIFNGNCENTGNSTDDNTNDDTEDSTEDNFSDDTEDSTEDNTDLTYAQQVVNLVNIQRATEGLAPLTLDAKVTTAANVRATEIQTSFSHTRPNGSSFSTVLRENGIAYNGSGENIAYGQRSPEEVVEGWMNSAGHRANIMNPNFKNIGVGHAVNSNGTQYWVQLFTY